MQAPNSAVPADPEPTLDDIAPWNQLVAECEERKIATGPQLEWMWRNREENGMGAAVHKKQGRRFASRRKFAKWLTQG